MEHRALIPNGVELVRSNALATYLGLVSSVEGAVVTRPSGFTLVRGPGVFSFCNFAAGFDLSPEEAERDVVFLAQQAREVLEFYVFVMTGDNPEGFSETLMANGFQRRQSLVSMASSLAPEPPDVGACVVTDQDERRGVAAFMARQFFWRMPTEARNAISAATAASPHTIWAIGDAQAPTAAVMLVEQPQAVGLFNLCVKPNERGKGLGTNIVRAVQSASACTGRTLVLQCGEELAGWYLNLGFERVGSVDAYTLAPPSGSDILL